MSKQVQFMIQSRPYGGGYGSFVGIKCGWCGTEEWHPCNHRSAGWALRMFRNSGWLVGNKDKQHRCRICFGKARNAKRRKLDNPVISPELGKEIKEKLKETQMAEKADPLTGTKTALMGSSMMVHNPETVWVAEKPPEAASPQPPAQEPPVSVPAKPRGRSNRALPGVSVISRRDNCIRAARLALGADAKEGVEFYTVPRQDGWTWIHAADISPHERAAWEPKKHFGPRKKKEHLPMASTVTPITRKDPMPTPLSIAIKIVATVDTPREITREERGRIHDELTKVYDIVAERYVGHDSDKLVATRLDVPRKGVTDIREMFFGGHDRNDQTEIKKKELDAAIVIAKAATVRLLEMSAEAETIEQSLVAARKKLEG